MKRILMTAALSAALISPALAICYETKAFTKNALENYGEAPLWTSKGDNGLIVTMFYNPETGTWGIVEGDSENVCVMGSGKGIAPAETGEPV